MWVATRKGALQDANLPSDEGGQVWVALGATVDDAMSRVSVAVSQLSVFAVLREPGSVEEVVYLPVVVKQKQ